jgi:predicted site-specific integrase-resolvase
LLSLDMNSRVEYLANVCSTQNCDCRVVASCRNAENLSSDAAS